jgi:hypothetical protein
MIAFPRGLDEQPSFARRRPEAAMDSTDDRKAMKVRVGPGAPWPQTLVVARLGRFFAAARHDDTRLDAIYLLDAHVAKLATLR